MQHFVVLVVYHAGGHRFHVAGWCYELDGAVDGVIHQAVVIGNIAGWFWGDFQGWCLKNRFLTLPFTYLWQFFLCFCFSWQNNPLLPRLVNCSGNGGAAECVLAEEALSCVCLPESKPLLSFQVGFFDLLPLAPSLPLPLPAQPHQWFSFFGVNIPAECVCFVFCLFCFFKYTALLLPLSALVDAAWSMQRWGNHDTSHTTGLVREMFNLLLSSSSVCVPLIKVFISKCMLKRKRKKKKLVILNYCHTLLTASRGRWWFIKD